MQLGKTVPSGRDVPFRSEVQPTPHQAQTWHSWHWHSLQDKSWAVRDLSVGRSNGEAMLNVAYTYIQYIMYIYVCVCECVCVCHLLCYKHWEEKGAYHIMSKSYHVTS